MVKAGGPFLLPVGVPSDLFSCETGMYIWRTTPFDKMGWEKVPTPYRDAIMNHLKMRAKLMDKEPMVFEAHAKKIESLLEKSRKDLRDSEPMKAKRREFARMLCKYHTVESWVGSKRVGDVLWNQTKKHKDNKELTTKKKNTMESKNVPTMKKENTIKSIKVLSLRDEINEKLKETVVVDEVMAVETSTTHQENVEKQTADVEVEQNKKKTSENVDVAHQEKALTKA
ncbi:uncharacterized protein LOC110930326 isoform X2 [Helianthus annuus]|uniref:uncharacterized protein LOC110930326 isoform X2 n=1 Tax=Helianthus annuus TaxID=4232 RepID=UPI000B903A25|nr:uncharacterized protein LOC110930326 isoform X2 [Helianthus annuus]XP_035844212.1 uncharacterized protein LOC110930326 isoform X2 [Helianthus annuus]